MSAAKRRIKRKIKMLVRMDDTRSRMLNDMSKGMERATKFWAGPMMALAHSFKLGEQTLAMIAIRRSRAKRGERA